MDSKKNQQTISFSVRGETLLEAFGSVSAFNAFKAKPPKKDKEGADAPV